MLVWLTAHTYEVLCVLAWDKGALCVAMVTSNSCYI